MVDEYSLSTDFSVSDEEGQSKILIADKLI